MEWLEEEISPKLRTILNGMVEGISIIDKDMRIVWVNSVVERWAGKLEDIKGSYCFKTYQRRDETCEDCPTVKTFKTGKVEKARQHAYDTEGNIKYFEFISAPITDAEGRIAAAVELASDLTKELELEQILKETKRRLQAIFDGIEDGISVINRYYEIVRANKRILNMFWKRDFPEILGKKCFSEYYQREVICDNCPAEKTFHDGKSCRITKILRKDDNKQVVLDIAAFPIKDEDGNVIQVIEYVKDISEKVNLEDQLLYSERLAGLGEVASGIAHEIRNPLGNISASSQFCLSRYELDEEVRKHFKIILKCSEKANRVIKNLLDLARPHQVFFKAGTVSRVIDSACNLMKGKCSKQRVRLSKRWSKRLPQILLDERRLEEAFLNFILNAVDAMPKGGRLAITAYYDHNAEEIVTSFADSGCGISEENLSKIFDPFFTTKKGGVGLGLSLAHKIIDYHKGKIYVESKINHGTEVIVRLPIYKEEISENMVNIQREDLGTVQK